MCKIRLIHLHDTQNPRRFAAAIELDKRCVSSSQVEMIGQFVAPQNSSSSCCIRCIMRAEKGSYVSSSFIISQSFLNLHRLLVLQKSTTPCNNIRSIPFESLYSSRSCLMTSPTSAPAAGYIEGQFGLPLIMRALKPSTKYLVIAIPRDLIWYSLATRNTLMANSVFCANVRCAYFLGFRCPAQEYPYIHLSMACTTSGSWALTHFDPGAVPEVFVRLPSR